jgi:hypothetical protein
MRPIVDGFTENLSDLCITVRAIGGFGFGTVGSPFILASIMVICMLFTSRSLVSGEANTQASLLKQDRRIPELSLSFSSQVNVTQKRHCSRRPRGEKA